MNMNAIMSQSCIWFCRNRQKEAATSVLPAGSSEQCHLINISPFFQKTLRSHKSLYPILASSPCAQRWNLLDWRLNLERDTTAVRPIKSDRNARASFGRVRWAKGWDVTLPKLVRGHTGHCIEYWLDRQAAATSLYDVRTRLGSDREHRSSLVCDLIYAKLTALLSRTGSEGWWIAGWTLQYTSS